MGRGITAIDLADLPGVVGRYNNVIYMNDPSDTDLVKTINGSPRTIIINLGQLLNIATGDIQGDAIAIDELEATEIADDAVRGRELAETPSLFENATEVTFDHDTGTGAVLVAANAAGRGDRLVICQVEVTATFASTSWEIDVGSAGSSNGLFDNIFSGLATLQINETLAGAYLLPEGEALTVTKTSMVGATTGQLTFRLLTIAPDAKSIQGNQIADAAAGSFENVSATNVAFDTGSPAQILASHATDDRLCLIMGIATVTAAGTPDFDVGSATTDINAAFDQLATGAWVVGDRFIGACMLPAGEDLVVTITGAPSAGAIDFYVIPLTVVPAGVHNLFVGGTELEHDHATGTQQLLAANAAGGGDRLLVVQAECTEAFITASWEIDVGSTAAVGGLFTDIFGGDAALAIGESVIGTYLLPELEALTITENSMVTDTAGKIMFRVLVNTPAADSIPGNLLKDNAVGDFQGAVTVNVADTETPTKQLLASHATDDRIVMVMGVATVTAAGTPDFSVGSAVTDPTSVFNDIEAGAWVRGERWVGACTLPAGEDLLASVTSGTGGAIDFHIVVLTMPTASAQNLFEDGTEVAQAFGTGTATLLAANAVGEGDRLVIVQAEVTTAWAGTNWEYDVGSTSAVGGLFTDIFGSPVPLDIGTSVIGAYLLPEAEALVCTENNMVMTAGVIMFRILISAPAAGSITGALLADEGVNFPYGVTPTSIDHGDGLASHSLLVANANNDRIVLVTAIATQSGDGTVDFDVGAAGGSEVFADLALGDWVVGDRYFGAMVLPATEALECTINTAGGSGAIDFYVTVLTPTVQNAQIVDGAVDTAELADAAVTGLKLESVGSLFDGSSAAITVYSRDCEAGSPETLLVANAATAGDRLLIVQAVCTEIFDLDEYTWIVGSTTDPNGLFEDIFGGDIALGLRESEMSAYILPAGEALVLLESSQTDGGTPTGKIDFRILDMGAITTARIAAGTLSADASGRALMATGLFDAVTALDKIAANAIVGSLIPNDAVGHFDLAEQAGTEVNVAHTDAGSKEIVALDADNDRIVIMMGIATVAAAAAPEWDVGVGAGNELFDDISGGTWVIGERWFGACVLPAGSAINCTLTAAGSAGAIDFYFIALIPTVDTANIADAAITGIKLAATPSLFETATTHDQHHDTGAGTILAANAVGGGDRLVIVQAECTEAFSDVTSWEWQVGSASDPNGLFADIFAGVIDLAVGETVMSAYLLLEAEALALVETDMTVGGAPTGIIRFRILHDQPAAGSIPGALLADDAIGLFEDITPTTVPFDGGSPQQILAADANSNRHVLVLAIATVTSELGVSDWNVGAAGGNELFDDIADGDWVAGERFMGACDLPAGSNLSVTLVAAGSQGSIDFYVIPLTPLAATANIASDAVTPDKVADIAAESAVAGVGFKMAMAEYTFSNLAADAGMFGATSIPSGALVMGGYLEVITQLTETNGGGEVDVGLDLEGGGDLLADTAWNGAPWSAPGFYDLLVDMTPASAILTTAPRDITISIVLNGATDIAGGAIRVVLFYIEPKTGAI